MDVLVERLRAAGCVFAEEEARLLRAHAGGDALEALVRRRVAGEPLEHLVEEVSFGDHRYRVVPGVFVPRARSMLLVREAVRLAERLEHAPAVVDLCCGCGALGLEVLARTGGRLHGVDLDPVAAACARANGVPEVAVGDLFAALPDRLRGHVDLVLANAPYVPTQAIATMPAEARDFEPLLALDGGADGLGVQRRILAATPDWLAPDGHLLVETSGVQADELSRLATAAGIRPRILTDEEIGATVLVGSLSRS